MNIKKIGDVYHAQFKTADGRTKTVTTRSTNKVEARRIAREAGVYELESAAKAGRLTREVIGQITAGKRITMSTALTEFIDWMRSVGRSDKTIENSGATVARWIDDCKLQSTPPSVITEKHINAWLNNPALETKANTRATLLSSVRAFFLFCSARGWSIGDPSRLVEVNYDIMTHAQKEATEREPFTNQEINRLLAYTQEQGMMFWHFAVMVSRETGLRLKDVCQLEWSCFDKDGYLIVWTAKRDKRVAVPVSRAITKFVSEIPVRSKLHMFPEQRDCIMDMKKRAHLSVQFGRLCGKCGITGKSFHSIRHMLVTELRKQGKSLKDIAQIVGHSSEQTTKVYDHSAPVRKLVLQ